MGRRGSAPGLRGAWATAWRRLGDPVALSQSAAWWFTPVGFVGPVLVDPLRLGGSPAFWIAVAGVGQIIVALGFWLGQRVVRALPQSFAPLGTLGVVILIVLMRGLFLAWATQEAGLTEGLELFYRTIGSIPMIGGALVLSALVACVRSEHRDVMNVLGERRDELERMQATLDGRLAEIHDQLRQQVADTLEPEIRDLEEALDAAAAGRTSVPLERLQALVDDDLRHLITELSNTQEEPTSPTPTSRRAVPSRVRLPATLPMSNALRPALQGVIIGAAATASVSRSLTVVPAITYCVAVALITAAVLALARLLLARWTPPTAIALVTATVLGGMATLSSVVITAALGIPSPDSLRGAGLAYGAACALGLATYRAVDSHRAGLEDDLADTVAQLEASTNTLRQRSWVARRRLSLLLHGSIQSALHAAALRLGSTREPDPETILRVRRDLAAALALLDAPPAAGVSLEETLDSIATTWAGHCDITWSITAEARRELGPGCDTCACVAEIAREATHNAIVHGRATQVSIDVSEVDGRVTVSVQDNGHLKGGEPGAGSAMLDEMCSSWSRTATASGTVLRTELSV